MPSPWTLYNLCLLEISRDQQLNPRPAPPSLLYIFITGEGFRGLSPPPGGLYDGAGHTKDGVEIQCGEFLFLLSAPTPLEVEKEKERVTFEKEQLTETKKNHQGQIC